MTRLISLTLMRATMTSWPSRGRDKRDVSFSHDRQFAHAHYAKIARRAAGSRTHVEQRHCEERKRRSNPESRPRLWIASLSLAMTAWLFEIQIDQHSGTRMSLRLKGATTASQHAGQHAVRRLVVVEEGS